MALKKKAKKKIIKKQPAKKKAIKRKPAKRSVPKKKAAKKKIKQAKKKSVVKPLEKPIGLITHYFPHVQAAVIKLKAPLSVGEKIRIKGHTTDFTQLITSMQIDRVDIASAKPGQEIGLLVSSRVRQHDVVTKA